MAKFCPGCGAPLEDAAKFCPGCGTQTVPAGAQAAQPQQQAQPPQPPPYGPYQPQQPYQPPYQQPYMPAPPPPPKKSKKPLIIGGAVGAFAVVLATVLAITNALGLWGKTKPIDLHTNAGATRGLGALDDDPAEVYALMLAGAADTAALPPHYDNSAAYPPPGDQGEQESCTGWAVAYALRSSQEEVDSWDSSMLFSPTYVYNQINNGMDKGSNIIQAINLLVEQGVCNLEDMPYDDSDYLTQPNRAQKASAYENRADAAFTVSGANQIKQAIITNGGAVIGVPVYPDFDAISTGDPVYDDASGDSRGNHAICLVGYDDSKQAFKFINSWGPDWGLDGFGYVSYEIACAWGYAGVITCTPKDRPEGGYTIKFNPGYGDGDMEPVSAAVGKESTLPKNGFTNSGAEFMGWMAYSTLNYQWLFVNDDGDDVGYYTDGQQPEGYDKALIPDEAVTDAIGFDENDTIILTAVWDSDSLYTVQFDPNGGEGRMSEVSVVSGNTWYIPNTQFTKQGTEFLGWYLYSTALDQWLCAGEDGGMFWMDDSEGGMKVLFGEGDWISNFNTEDRDKIILYAVWEGIDYCTLMFSAQGGTGHMEPMYAEVGDTITVPEGPYEKEGYAFAGWYFYSQSSESWLCIRGEEQAYYEEPPTGWRYWLLDAGDEITFDETDIGEAYYLCAVWVPNNAPAQPSR
ncbi:MAG: InlB B-repeat-containing protein [Oscillospiraceae bacterium]|jgi:hypothetical protein|nr:InlB B-repeat-containing protein [Oscillospiraceae bacterium]